MKHDRGIGERELKYAKKTYTVHFKMEQKVINLNSNISQLNLLYVKDIKNIDIDVKTGAKAKADNTIHNRSKWDNNTYCIKTKTFE